MNVTHDELIGASAADIMSEEMFNTVVRPAANKCMTGQQVRHQSWRNLPLRGSRHMDVVDCPYQTETGKTDGFVMSARDITETGELEHQLRQAKKIKTAEQLAGRVAHDFINLLPARIGFCELARKSIAPEERTYQHCGQDLTAASGPKLISQLLAFSRRQPLHSAGSGSKRRHSKIFTYDLPGDRGWVFL